MVIAFDFSMSTPALCIAFKPGWHHSQNYYLTDTKKYVIEKFIDGAIVKGQLHDEYLTQEQRFDLISSHFIETLNLNDIPSNTQVFMEDYSMGSKGKVFHMAENQGLMKYKLWKRGHDITPVAPTVIKKSFTGKGNAKKEDMYSTFVKETGIALATSLGANSNKIGSPISDIVDAFALAQYGLTLMKQSSKIVSMVSTHRSLQ